MQIVEPLTTDNNFKARSLALKVSHLSIVKREKKKKKTKK